MQQTPCVSSYIVNLSKFHTNMEIRLVQMSPIFTHLSMHVNRNLIKVTTERDFEYRSSAFFPTASIWENKLRKQ